MKCFVFIHIRKCIAEAIRLNFMILIWIRVRVQYECLLCEDVQLCWMSPIEKSMYANRIAFIWMLRTTAFIMHFRSRVKEFSVVIFIIMYILYELLFQIYAPFGMPLKMWWQFIQLSYVVMLDHIHSVIFRIFLCILMRCGNNILNLNRDILCETYLDYSQI